MISYICLILGLPIVGLVCYSITVRFADDEALQYATDVSQLVAAAISSRCTALEQEVFQPVTLHAAIAEYAAAPAETAQQAAVRTSKLYNTLNGQLYLHQDFRAVYYVDTQGRTTLSKRTAFTDSQPQGEVKAEYEKLLAARGRIVWEPYDDNHVVMKKLMYNTDTLHPEGYLGVIISRSSFSQPYASGKVSYALLNAGGSVLFYEVENTVQVVYSYRETGGTQGKIHIGGIEYLCLEVPGTAWKHTVIAILDMAVANQARRFFTVAMMLAMLLTTLAALLLSILFTSRMGRSQRAVLSGVRRIGEGELETNIQVDSRDEMYLVAEGINDMTERIRRLMANVLVEQKLKQEAEYQALEYRFYSLKCQIHPHLLFNTLESINGVAKLNDDFECSHLVCSLAALLRQTLGDRRLYMPLQEEIDYIRQYLAFYQRIYGDRLRVVYHVEKPLERMIIPSFIMIPLIENAIVHGVERTTSTCTIHIACYREEERVYLEIENDGPGIPAELLASLRSGAPQPHKPGHTSIGIRSVSERLDLLYSGVAKLDIETSGLSGVLARITLPCHTAEAENAIPGDARMEDEMDEASHSGG